METERDERGHYKTFPQPLDREKLTRQLEAAGYRVEFLPNHEGVRLHTPPVALPAAERPAPPEVFKEWETLRPKDFLEHAVKATSQYDAQYRSMAAEILALRAVASASPVSPPTRKRPEGWLEGEIELTAFALANPDCDVRAVLAGFAEWIRKDPELAAPVSDTQETTHRHSQACFGRQGDHMIGPFCGFSGLPAERAETTAEKQD